MKMGDAYIIVYSVTDKVSFEKASELRIQLRRARQTEDIPIILVGNKSDLVRSREVSVDGKTIFMYTIMSKLLVAKAAEDCDQQSWSGFDAEKCVIGDTPEKSSQLVHTGDSAPWKTVREDSYIELGSELRYKRHAASELHSNRLKPQSFTACSSC